MANKESRQSINREAAVVAKAIEKIKKGVTTGADSPYEGGVSTQKAFERNTKKRAVIQDYNGVLPLSAAIEREMDADLNNFATILEDDLQVMIKTLGRERATDELNATLETALRSRKMLTEDIQKKTQFITVKSNLEFIKTAVGSVRFKQLEKNKVSRAKMISYVGNNGWADVRQNSGDMFALITRKSDISKRQLANKFIAGLEQDQPVDLKKLIKEELGIIGKRATFIARDQTAKFNSIVTSNRMNDFGISLYQWIATTNDGRTRLLHLQRHLKYFLIGTPAAVNGDGMPGIPYNCRCNPKPVVNEQQALSIINAIMLTPAASYTGLAVAA